MDDKITVASDLQIIVILLLYTNSCGLGCCMYVAVLS